MVIFFALLFALSTGQAGKPKVGSDSGNTKFANGDWIACKLVNESRDDGDNRLLMMTISGKFSGVLNGSYEGAERDVVHKDGTQTFSGSGVLSGAVDGRSGTAVMTYSGTVNAKGDALANWVLDKGTDDIARVDGQGTFQGKKVQPAPAECTGAKTEAAWSGTYKGIVQFPR